MVQLEGSCKTPLSRIEYHPISTPGIRASGTYINFSTDSPFRFSLTDIRGRTVQKAKGRGPGPVKLDAPAGVYTLRGIVGNTGFAGRVVIGP